MVRYPISSKENSRRIRVEVRQVFLEVWDPIGIKGEPMAQDEYDSYLGRMMELLMSGADDAELKNYLDWCVNRMGMNSSRHSDTDVIAALRKIEFQELAS